MNKDIFEEKDILELFNYINIDKDEEENLDLNMDDLRKKRLKKNLLKQVKGKKTSKGFKHKVMAASLIIAVTLISVNIPAFAKNISEFKSVIQALVGYGVPKEGEYEKYSNSVNKSVTDKGITLTISEVVCDYGELMIGYTIKTKDNIEDIVKKEMKDNPIPFSLFSYIKINGKQPRSSSGSDPKYLNGYTYINSDSIDIGDMNLKNSFNVDLNVKNIYGVIGNWNLKLSVSKDEISKHTKMFEPNAKFQFPDALVNVEKVSFTPINTTISIVGKYNKEEYKDPEKREKAFNVEMTMGSMLYYSWFILDDKGNEIIFKGHSSSNVEDSSSKDFAYDLKFVNSKHIPKYLIVIPYRDIFSKNNSPIQETYKDINGVYPIELLQRKMGKIIIKEIKTYKDKTVVKYKVEGKAPFLQAKELSIMDDKGNWVERKDTLDNVKKDKDNPNDYIMEFDPLDENKKYKIGTNNLGHYDIRNDLKFRINLTK
ncbi:DUF4179 domain-containing protein [Clostridium botulinum]|nr:DUF4179 domain-containing protein [Clostridium botulinum]APC85172.1 hypothetical protein NPD12_1866 [Clostridium botulinum]AXG94989.1 DUF4179 domain-containing protein [Clostridium botulinum]EDT80798.1 conserved hypothetical protein [Clostridium botulinum NCTC 2916]MBY6772978.1 DUF4179 domain-containing protein [Clostridium botulinum]MBY6776469.1 DUF4179 domain-containing protein [Clostridium botulinum]